MGVYTAGETAGTEVSSTYEGRHLTVLETELIHPNHLDGLVDKGDPVIVVLGAATPHAVKAQAVGVALASATAATDYIAVDTEGIWNLNVNADDDGGNVDVNPGDALFISDDSAASDDSSHDGVGDAVLSKIRNNAIQVPFGYALGYIGAGAYGVIAVKVHWDPLSHWLLDDEMLYFGDARDISVEWNQTELEMLPLTNNTSFHIGNGVNLLDMEWFGSAVANVMTFDASENELTFVGVTARFPEDELLEFGDAAERYMAYTGRGVDFTAVTPCNEDETFYGIQFDCAPECTGPGAGAEFAASRHMVWPSGTAYQWVSGLEAMVDQDDTKHIDGYFQAGIFIIKNDALACSTASSIRLEIENTAAAGFGGVMHSFISCVDRSAADRDCQCLFELQGMDATTAAAADEIVCQAGAANAASHVIKISANGVPYWILTSSTPPA